MIWIKIGALILAAGAIIGAGIYVRYVFNDREALQVKNGSLSAKLEAERGKYIELQKQTEQILQMQTRIIEAVKRVKINSTTYINSVESAKLAAPAAGGVVLFPGGMPQALPGLSNMPLFGNHSANRAAPRPP